MRFQLLPGCLQISRKPCQTVSNTQHAVMNFLHQSLINMVAAGRLSFWVFLSTVEERICTSKVPFCWDEPKGDDLTTPQQLQSSHSVQPQHHSHHQSTEKQSCFNLWKGLFPISGNKKFFTSFDWFIPFIPRESSRKGCKELILELQIPTINIPPTPVSAAEIFEEWRFPGPTSRLFLEEHFLGRGHLTCSGFS